MHVMLDVVDNKPILQHLLESPACTNCAQLWRLCRVAYTGVLSFSELSESCFLLFFSMDEKPCSSNAAAAADG